MKSSNFLFFLLTALIVGMIVTQVLSHFHDVVPYTTILFLIGIAASQLTSESLQEGDKLSLWSQSTAGWANIDPELVLYTLLPPLIFGEAVCWSLVSHLNFFHVVNAFWQSVILGGPGVVIGTFIMGGVLYGVENVLTAQVWSFNLCLLFGAIVSATDPVSIVELLKEHNASPNLTILIVGESLLNNGMTETLYLFFKKLVDGKTYSNGDIVAFFVNAIIGSTVFGIFCGFIMVFWLQTTQRHFKEVDRIIQILVTVLGSYLIFFISQFLLMQIGVLACCGAGAVMAWLAPPLILSRESVQKIWEVIEWLANTLIFMLAGLIFGTSLKHVTYVEWGIALLLYIILFAIRIFNVIIFFPIISRIGHKCTINEAIFISWAGTRGFLSLVLALIVTKNLYVSVDIGQIFFFYVGAISFLTLIINGTLSPYVLKKLKLIEDEHDVSSQIVTIQITKRMKMKMLKILSTFNESDQDKEDIRNACSLFSDEYADKPLPGTTLVRRSSSLRELLHSPVLGNNSNNNLNLHSPVLGNNSNSNSNSNNNNLNLNNDTIGENTENNNLHNSLNNSLNNNNNSTNNNNLNSSHNNLIGHNSLNDIIEPATPREVMLAFSQLKKVKKERNLIPALLAYYRTTFLESVRKNYLKSIESGRLSRKSYTATFLLYSIDVALDAVRLNTELQDWKCIEHELNSVHLNTRLYGFLRDGFQITYFTNEYEDLTAQRERREVWMLISFIDAHERSIAKLHEYADIGEDIDDQSISPEEIQIKSESTQSLRIAKERLSRITHSVVEAVLLRQKTLMLLAREAKLVDEMLSEGLLAPNHAERFFAQIDKDRHEVKFKTTEKQKEISNIVRHNSPDPLIDEEKHIQMTNLNFKKSSSTTHFSLMPIKEESLEEMKEDEENEETEKLYFPKQNLIETSEIDTKMNFIQKENDLSNEEEEIENDEQQIKDIEKEVNDIMNDMTEMKMKLSPRNDDTNTILFAKL